MIDETDELAEHDVEGFAFDEETLACANVRGNAIAQCTSAGVPSSVCIAVGMSASMSSTVSAPVMPKSSAVSGSPALEKQAIIRPSRARRAGRTGHLVRGA